MTIGRNFQRETKYYPGEMPSGYDAYDTIPAPYKKYPDAVRVKLPEPETGGGPLWEALRKRRSERSYGKKAVTEKQLSQLLWASQGLTAKQGGYLFRTAPSAGALYPIETYVGIRDVGDIAPGIYHYDVMEWDLAEVKGGDFSGALAKGALGQKMVRSAPVVFLWTAVFARSAAKYKDRGYRYVYLDCGHIAQNLLLAVTALGLSACPIAALFDDEINEILGVDGEEESILYMVSVGTKA
jgi:SagB-type dehydrogenase family enzyme